MLLNYTKMEEKTKAAAYVRMSTEHQKYSPANQMAAIRSVIRLLELSETRASILRPLQHTTGHSIASMPFPVSSSLTGETMTTEESFRTETRVLQEGHHTPMPTDMLPSSTSATTVRRTSLRARDTVSSLQELSDGSFQRSRSWPVQSTSFQS